MFIRFMISDALRDAGYDVIEAFNADEAIDVFHSGVHIDMVFTDVRMPGSRDGLDLLNFVREFYLELPVLLTSGHLPPSLVPTTKVLQFLPKPYLVEHVLTLVADALVPGQ